MASVRIELTRPCGHWILSPARLPIPPRGQWPMPNHELRHHQEVFSGNVCLLRTIALFN